MMIKTIGGITFKATRQHGPRGSYWVAVIENSGKELPQQYDSKPKLWEDLETCYKLSSQKQWEAMR